MIIFLFSGVDDCIIIGWNKKMNQEGNEGKKQIDEKTDQWMYIYNQCKISVVSVYY